MAVSRRFASCLAAAMLGLAIVPALAADDLVPLDPATVEPGLFEGMLGRWQVADEAGERTCTLTLDREATIGGMLVEVDPACPAVFPILGEVAAWRLYEGWVVVLADATRKELIRFTTPDERYIATPVIDGLATLSKQD